MGIRGIGVSFSVRSSKEMKIYNKRISVKFSVLLKFDISVRIFASINN